LLGISINLPNAGDVEIKESAIRVVIRHTGKPFNTSPYLLLWFSNEHKVTRVK
jgi:hypothetical protein